MNEDFFHRRSPEEFDEVVRGLHDEVTFWRVQFRQQVALEIDRYAKAHQITAVVQRHEEFDLVLPILAVHDGTIVVGRGI